VRLVHDKIVCELHGLCVATDPARFAFDDDDELVVHDYEVRAEDVATVKRAVASCPRQALSLVEG
jgi:ferredoxin